MPPLPPSPPPPPSLPGWVLGVDSGGSGLRVGLGRLEEDGTLRLCGSVAGTEPVRTGAAGIDAGHLAAQLVPAARALLQKAGGGGPVTAVCVGAAGLATLGGQLRAELPGALGAALGVRRLALAADAVTGYAGALGERPGAVVVAGTGMIAVGTDLIRWRRADGWGHLLGDCGGGAWIGRAGLEAAMRAHDGRDGGSAALLARATERFGPVEGLPQQLYPRTDRAAVLASFAPDVAACAAADNADPADPVARRILGEAARQIAATAAAVCPPERGSEVALTGGLFRIGEPLLAPLREALTRRLPGASVVPAAGDPLDGALLVAAGLGGDALGLPTDPSLLRLVTTP
ncbi:N-acetylglucosamine kinase [Streptomyces sp. 6N223]|uniref:N-acetylglucosamine kinase n=1 Tax=Streptomyces sp. 6N223 TaxID=3457412 RepID=UPI003FD2384F